MEPIKLEYGRSVTAERAKEVVDRLYALAGNLWEGQVMNGRFQRELAAGTLPMPALRLFWKNFYGFVMEMNNLIASTMQRHLPFLKLHGDLMAALCDKVADELIHPRPPGHILVMAEQGKNFGLTEEEMLHCQMLPECRAMVEWRRGLFYEGTMAEWYAATVLEEVIGEWSAAMRKVLREKYSLPETQIKYFKVHEEADLQPHDGTMAHGAFNRMVLQRLLQEGRCDLRPGFTLDYCVRIGVYFHAQFREACYRHAGDENGW